MGCVISPEAKAAENKSKELDRELRRGHDNKKPMIKILLLGTGESGKSTSLKQMKIIHKNGFSAEEKEQMRQVIMSNIAQFFDILVQIYKMQTDIVCSDSEKEMMSELSDFYAKGSFATIPPEICGAMKTLWANPNFKKLVEQSQAHHLNIALTKLADEVERICQPGYVPTEGDALLARVKTTGIQQIEFEFKNTIFIICDVGGQRSERRKWVNTFEDVDAIIFFIAISEYNQTLEEDPTVNRIAESKKLLESILSSPWFTRSSIILFLNKHDLFLEKLKTSDFKQYFPDFEGDPKSPEQTQDYLRQQFEALNKQSDQREIYTHFTNATDTTQMARIFDAVSDIVMKKNLREYGLY
ncbi:Guanine nucleotide-binding protein alpha-16 subunit [Thelohanellus kitauei]|uniref:Guanine nucleotide-binding protein alpha-16 subunit n=1 Tax=Thelohanellus kitauei TaxID=669202 RepID=A0A0C2J297_THEKT|nr:Guanine nucleotide-binding protein alpha-16 subunit [Thelohanellus kitauei]